MTGTMKSECKEVKPEKKCQKCQKVAGGGGFTDIWVGNGWECLYTLCMVLLGDRGHKV